MKRALPRAALAATALLAAQDAMAIEEPEYKLLSKQGPFELRRYQPRLVAEVEVRAGFEDAGNQGFRPLADYIFGNNQPEQKISMTAPVTQQARDGEKIAMTAPVTQHSEGGAWVVRFAMPREFDLDTLPRPRDSRVKLRRLEAETVAVIRYSGRWSEANYAENLAALRQQLRARDLREAGPPVWARYNAPFTPWFLRRNEIHVPVDG